MPQPPGGEVPKPPFEEIQPGVVSGNGLHVKPRIPLHPPADRQMLAGWMVAHDKMQWTFRECFPLQPLQELNPFLMPMPWLTSPPLPPGQHIEGGKVRAVNGKPCLPAVPTLPVRMKLLCNLFVQQDGCRLQQNLPSRA